MTDILLAKPKLEEGWVDWSVGESTIIRQSLFRHLPSLISPEILTINRELSVNSLEYQNPAGYGPLVDMLEEKHNAPVVITNGAKQALAASFYALKKENYDQLFLQPIFWALLPPLINALGLDYYTQLPSDIKGVDSYSAYLLLCPNNPCGKTYTHEEMTEMQQKFRDHNMPLIHDAAYYTNSYLPRDYKLGPVGDMQIFSFSKSLGLSGIRGGYIVAHNKEFYKHLVEYQEMMTVGVSIFTQKFLHTVLQDFKKAPEKQVEFEDDNFQMLKEAKNIMRDVSKKVLEVPDDFDALNGMFGFLKVNDKDAFKRAKIHIVDGVHFGDANKVRVNLAIGNEKLKTFVEKLNGAVE